MEKIAVFCGSSSGFDPAFADMARRLGETLARRDIAMVYGGGRVGLMGIVADAVMNAGGTVIGVIPRDLMNKELGHTGISQLRVTATMHERKAAMEQEADGFIALPGGYGTLDEFCEILTWAQLGIHRKPCAVLDTKAGFFTHLLAFFDDAVDAGFVRAEHRDMIVAGTDPDDVIDRMAAYTPAIKDKWIDLKGDVVPDR